MSRLAKRWRRFEVRLQKSDRVQALLRGAYARYIAFVYRTTRWRWIGMEPVEADITNGVPRAFVCWHARLALVTYLRSWDDHDLAVIASRHADAQIIIGDLTRRGIAMINVSTSRGDGGPIREAVRTLRRGASLGITVDGPLGPPEIVKPGALVIAGLAGIELTPCAVAVSRSVRLNTWDRFILPLPFGRGVFVVAPGFTPPPRRTGAALDAACARVAAMIADVTARADAELGRPPQGSEQ